VIRVNEGGWYDPLEGGKPGTLCRWGDVNVLTVDIGTSKLAQGNCGHTVIGEMEKYTGPAVTVEVFDEPKSKA
jgi:trimethylamine-N-oxide reductase (cytochrome c)